MNDFQTRFILISVIFAYITDNELSGRDKLMRLTNTMYFTLNGLFLQINSNIIPVNVNRDRRTELYLKHNGSVTIYEVFILNYFTKQLKLIKYNNSK